MKNLFAIIIMCLFIINVKAQNYKASAGLSLGAPSGLSFKYFLNESSAVEAILSYKRNSLNGSYFYNIRVARIGLGASYLRHQAIETIDGLSWYAGGGVSIFKFIVSSQSQYASSFGGSFLGIHGSAGLDYRFENYPINLSLDWSPTYFINGYFNGFRADYGAVAIRYIIK